MPLTAKLRVMRSALELIQDFPLRRVLVVGDLVADHYLYGQTDRISREAPVLVVRYESAEVKLGGGANAAANVRSLGGQVSAVGGLGRDEMGAAMRRLCRSAGIRLQAATTAQTETKTRILAGGLNTTRQQMLRVDRGAAGRLPATVRQALAQHISRLAVGADAVLVSDYGAGVLDAETRGVLRGLAKDGLPVCVDSRFSLQSFTGFTVCKPNEPELEQLVGQRIRTDAELVTAGRAAVKLLRCEALVVTRGHNGVAVFDSAGHAELIPVHGASEAVDVTGAGDTVMATLTLAIAAGAEVPEAARLANIAGALVVQKQGTAAVTRAELLRELDLR